MVGAHACPTGSVTDRLRSPLPRDKASAAVRCFVLLTVFGMSRLAVGGRAPAADWVLGCGALYVLATTFWRPLRRAPRKSVV